MDSANVVYKACPLLRGILLNLASSDLFQPCERENKALINVGFRHNEIKLHKLVVQLLPYTLSLAMENQPGLCG